MFIYFIDTIPIYSIYSYSAEKLHAALTVNVTECILNFQNVCYPCTETRAMVSACVHSCVKLQAKDLKLLFCIVTLLVKTLQKYPILFGILGTEVLHCTCNA